MALDSLSATPDAPLRFLTATAVNRSVGPSANPFPDLAGTLQLSDQAPFLLQLVVQCSKIVR